MIDMSPMAGPERHVAHRPMAGHVRHVAQWRGHEDMLPNGGAREARRPMAGHVRHVAQWWGKRERHEVSHVLYYTCLYLVSEVYRFLSIHANILNSFITETNK